MEKTQIYISIDTEFEDENVKTGNCLQLAFVAFKLEEGKREDLKRGRWEVDNLSVCFKDQFLTSKNENVLKFWEKFPDILERIHDEAVPIEKGINKIHLWLLDLMEKYTIVDYVCDISCVDFCWFKNLYLTYQKENQIKLPYKCLCTHNIKNTLLELNLISKSDLDYICYCSEFPHTHYALDDARLTAFEFLSLKNLMKRFRKENV